MVHMDKGIKTVAAFLVTFAFVICAIPPSEEVTADDDASLTTTVADDGKLILDAGAPLTKEKSPYGENYVHWFSLAIVALLVLAVLGYLHIKAHKH